MQVRDPLCVVLLTVNVIACSPAVINGNDAATSTDSVVADRSASDGAVQSTDASRDSTVVSHDATTASDARDSGTHAPPDVVVDAPHNNCIADGTCPPGQWIDVTPSNASLTEGACGNYGTLSAQVDPMRPQDLYSEFNCQGIWKSTNYGGTWTGPINTGTNGTAVADCAGGIRIAPHSSANPPVLYESCIRGAGIGFWRSVNGGVDWTRYTVAPTPDRQDYYPPVVDPYDDQHLLMGGHEMNVVVESSDGGQTWTNIPTVAGMNTMSLTPQIVFIDTGDATTTRSNWLWIAASTGGIVGTWRTTDSGTNWTHVDNSEHTHSYFQLFQPDTTGTVILSGLYSTLGGGVIRSTDYGMHWAHVGPDAMGSIAFGSSRHTYSMWGWAIGAGQTVDPLFMIGDATGNNFARSTTPAAMSQGPAEAVVTNDGTNNIILIANYNAGLWRYVEPTN